MKTNYLLASAVLISVLASDAGTKAADITATGSGNWSSTVPDGPWPGGIVPGPNDDVDVESPYTITVDTTNAAVQFIYGSGTLTMAPGSTLTLNDPAGAQATYQLANLDASAPGNTIIYAGNPFWAKHQDYFNLVFSNTVTTNLIDFYNGYVNSQDPAANMTIAGDMTVIGKIKVQQGADFTIRGNLIMGTNSQWDCSSFHLTVLSNTTIGGLMIDLDGALGSNYFAGNVTVTAGSTGWNITDVTHWAIGGNLTNNNLIVGKGYGSIAFDGTGVIAGKPFKIPTMTVNGTYTIGTTITLATNTPTLNGTLVFDLANTNQLVMQSYPANPLTLYYAGNLNVINTGPAPASGNSYKFFNATNYDGAFSSQTFPSLPAGLSWVDNLLTSGSIAVIGSVAGQPVLNLSRNGNLLTLSWDSTTFPGYSVQGQTNSAGLGTSWGPTGSGTNSPFTVLINPANRPVFYRLAHP
jgi:hypothetical protein